MEARLGTVAHPLSTLRGEYSFGEEPVLAGPKTEPRFVGVACVSRYCSSPKLVLSGSPIKKWTVIYWSRESSRLRT